MRIRSYVDSVLALTPGANILVLGDMNDGPGLDYFEKNFLTHNVIDILFGSQFKPEHVHHAEYSTQVVNNGTHREDRPSDHRPVSVRLRY
jgi:hypothetical protein